MAGNGSIEGVAMLSTLDFARLLPKVEVCRHVYGYSFVAVFRNSFACFVISRSLEARCKGVSCMFFPAGLAQPHSLLVFESLIK